MDPPPNGHLATPHQSFTREQLQQMVLCPVKVVYDAQILLPPDADLRSNQFIYLNSPQYSNHVYINNNGHLYQLHANEQVQLQRAPGIGSVPKGYQQTRGYREVPNNNRLNLPRIPNNINQNFPSIQMPSPAYANSHLPVNHNHNYANIPRKCPPWLLKQNSVETSPNFNNPTCITNNTGTQDRIEIETVIKKTVINISSKQNKIFKSNNPGELKVISPNNDAVPNKIIKENRDVKDDNGPNVFVNNNTNSFTTNVIHNENKSINSTEMVNIDAVPNKNIKKENRDVKNYNGSKVFVKNITNSFTTNVINNEKDSINSTEMVNIDALSKNNIKEEKRDVKSDNGHKVSVNNITNSFINNVINNENNSINSTEMVNIDAVPNKNIKEENRDVKDDNEPKVFVNNITNSFKSNVINNKNISVNSSEMVDKPNIISSATYRNLLNINTQLSVVSDSKPDEDSIKSADIFTQTDAKKDKTGLLKLKNVQNGITDKNKNRATEKSVSLMKLKKFKNVTDKNKNRVTQKSMNTLMKVIRNNKGINIRDKCEKDERYVLTHVIDGVVIQESNLPFSVTAPIKVKTNFAKSQNTESKETSPNGISTDSECQDKNTEMSTLFPELTSDVVKDWDTYRFVSHFHQLGMRAVADVFQEQELDGEALALVVPVQLQTVGIGEQMATLICKFMGNENAHPL